ncbi:ABC transporter substrate-binding protein [Pseudorhodoplanes sinuspersici]|uniref:Nitrate ABC transporter substrate-binding protein n=1 Tax=Pseudorhodoplanes sinuspersici TaxID=1235591 RepID=A0A1W6ZMF7_9HYPH|nr:ABC transporter substrate-binding protein [Pseudorhodoplanes sinuspersici]ARP98502.1 nitrate ABC transporter substrate-binding protein [Pseudorhodoplanes sinuspersici]RKE65912.1 ABC-type nitrate/sulfonate/bicarbonate transport system substrate-binding protein [Pseudorhodoplanes sinuspersici]
MKLAVPDLITNSYFPVVAAAELGFFKQEGLDISVELIAPAGRTYEALRDGEADFVAAEAHAGLAAFPDWKGMKLICALSQGMYWFLVMRSDIAGKRGDVSVVRGRRIAAAPWVELGLRRLLTEAGIDPEKDGVRIAPLEGSLGPKVNIGVTAARALAEGRIDGFWANGMGAELAVMSGAGKIVLDVRRGDGPKVCFDYTLPTLATSDRLIESNPEAAHGAVRAIAATLRALRDDVSLATQAARNVFPAQETELIAELIRRDLPYYDPMISEHTVAVMNQFCHDMGVLRGTPSYTDVVAVHIMTSDCKS